VKSDPSNAGWQRDLAIAFERVGNAQVAQKDLLSALKSYGDGAAVLIRMAGANSDSARLKSDIVSAAARIGTVSYDLVVARDFANALQAADQSIALAPGTIWLYSGRAYALMFLGRTDEARALFLKYRGQQDGMSQGELWEKTILGDFADLRKHGLTNLLMDEVEKLFTSAG
jgi:tetratricopeptide (TPR) repeat protein